MRISAVVDGRIWLISLCAGGSHDYWGGPGYERCRARIGPDFEDVFYKNNWASNVKMHSVYMFYGYERKSLVVLVVSLTHIRWQRN